MAAPRIVLLVLLFAALLFAAACTDPVTPLESDPVSERNPATAIVAYAGTRIVFDSRDRLSLERFAGPPQTFEIPILVPNAHAFFQPFRLIISNFGIASARVFLDDEEILPPREFGRKRKFVDARIELGTQTDLTVELRGAPGSMNFRIEGDLKPDICPCWTAESLLDPFVDGAHATTLINNNLLVFERDAGGQWIREVFGPNAVASYCFVIERVGGSDINVLEENLNSEQAASCTAEFERMKTLLNP